MESIKKSEIVLFWDLNPDKTINPELIEKKLKLKYSHSNKSIITREEIRNGKKIRKHSWLLLFNSENWKITKTWETWVGSLPDTS